MAGNLLEAVLKCGCCGGACTGCCFCPDDPATNVNYVISAPSCALIDGLTGNISGPDVGTPTGCGSCVSLPNSLQSHSVPTYVWDDSLPEQGCTPQPGAQFQFRFIIKCDENQPDSETDSGTTDPCCRNVRLLIVETGTDQIRREIAPSMCSCDEATGMFAIFPLYALYEDCETFYIGGVCDGYPTCAQIGDFPGGSCSMLGATLTISQNCPP